MFLKLPFAVSFSALVIDLDILPDSSISLKLDSDD